MRIEYLEKGSPDCPIVKIYNCTLDEYKYLCNQFNLLHKSDNSFKLNDTPSTLNIEFNVGELNQGVKLKDDSNFICILTKGAYKNIADLVSPFITKYEKENQSTRFQWLNEDSDISLLLSTNGKW